MKKRIAIVGSRDFSNLYLVEQYIRSMSPKHYIVVSGGARGVDKVAEETAKFLGFETEIYLADWDKHYMPGRKNPAGMIRNHEMINASDFVVAFWDGKSPGTKHSISAAKNRNKLSGVYGHKQRDIDIQVGKALGFKTVDYVTDGGDDAYSLWDNRIMFESGYEDDYPDDLHIYPLPRSRSTYIYFEDEVWDVDCPYFTSDSWAVRRVDKCFITPNSDWIANKEYSHMNALQKCFYFLRTRGKNHAR